MAPLTAPQPGPGVGRSAAVPGAKAVSLGLRTRVSSRCMFFLPVLKTVTASEKYPGGPGWESASAAFTQGGSRGPASGGGGRGTGSAEEGTERERREKGGSPGAEQRANADAEPRGAPSASGPLPPAGGGAASPPAAPAPGAGQGRQGQGGVPARAARLNRSPRAVRPGRAPSDPWKCPRLGSGRRPSGGP